MRWLAGLVVGSLLLWSCGGEEFGAGGGATGGMAGAGGAGASGGAAGSGAAPFGGAAGAVGGSAGASGGSAGAGGGVGGVAGAGGGAGGAGGAAGASGAGGSGGGPVAWPHCGLVAGLPVKLYTTLNDSASIQTPKSGTGPGTHNPASAFVTGMCGAGFLLDAAGEYVSYPGSNIKLASGTIDFWYVPDDLETDPRVMHFFATSDSTTGGIKITKLAGGEGSYFEVVLVDSVGVVHATQISPNDYSFVVGTPIRITVAWSTAVAPAGAPAVRVWFDKVEITNFVKRAQYPITMPAVAPATLYVGAESASDPTPANGAMDDFKIYGAPFAPQ